MLITRFQARQMAWQVLETLPMPSWLGIRQIEIESDFDNDAKSSTGCIGICQINPRDALQPGYSIKPCLDPLNIAQAVSYLSDYYIVAKKRRGSSGNALLAYNVGISSNLDTASRAYKLLAVYADSVYGG